MTIAFVGALCFNVILATLVAARLSPKVSLLDDQWRHMYSEKSLAIKNIQTSFECCGFMSVKDRAYPFPDSHHTANACVEKYGYTQPCAPQMANATHSAAVIFFLVVFFTIVSKVAFVYFIGRAEITRGQISEIGREYFDNPEESQEWERLQGAEHSNMLIEHGVREVANSVDGYGSLIASVDD